MIRLAPLGDNSQRQLGHSNCFFFRFFFSFSTISTKPELRSPETSFRPPQPFFFWNCRTVADKADVTLVHFWGKTATCSASDCDWCVAIRNPELLCCRTAVRIIKRDGELRQITDRRLVIALWDTARAWFCSFCPLCAHLGLNWAGHHRPWQTTSSLGRKRS